MKTQRISTRHHHALLHHHLMKAGAVHGEGMKGRVMDYGTRTEDLDSLEYVQLDGVREVKIHVLEKNAIVERTMGPEFIDELIHLDKKQQYVVKEFTVPNLALRTFGESKHTYMMREINGFKNILPLVKKHKVVGIPYGKNATLLGFQIVMKASGFLYDGTHERCFVVNRKCSQMMSEMVVNAFTEKQFVQFVQDILSTLVEIQKLNVAHGDIRLNNIMKCGTKYELIDWETNRLLDYAYLSQHRDFGLSPLYYKIIFGEAWYAAFKVALPVYYSVTGGYDESSTLTSAYADNINAYYSDLFAKMSVEDTLQRVKYSLDLCAVGMILYGILMRNKNIQREKHRPFIMNLFKMKDAAAALRAFRSLKTVRASRKNVRRSRKAISG